MKTRFPDIRSWRAPAAGLAAVALTLVWAWPAVRPDTAPTPITRSSRLTASAPALGREVEVRSSRAGQMAKLVAAPPATLVGSAFGLKASLLGLNVGPLPTVILPAPGGVPLGETMVSASMPGVLTAQALSAKTAGSAGPPSPFVDSSASIAEVKVGVGLSLLKISGITSQCRADGTGSTGSSKVATVTLAGLPIRISTTPGSSVGVPGVGTLVFNQQSTDAAGTLTVNAVSLRLAGLLNVGEVVLAQSRCGVTVPRLVSIAVTPANPSVEGGSSQQFQATGTFSDGSSRDVTSEVDWSSSASLAFVSNDPVSKGLATGVAPGQATITAADSGTGVNGSTTLTVTEARLVGISVTPTDTSVSPGATVPYTATGTYNDGTTRDITTEVTWTSSATGVATVSNALGSQGVATAASGGTTTITATDASTGLSATATLTVIDTPIG